MGNRLLGRFAEENLELRVARHPTHHSQVVEEVLTRFPMSSGLGHYQRVSELLPSSSKFSEALYEPLSIIEGERHYFGFQSHLMPCTYRSLTRSQLNSSLIL